MISLLKTRHLAAVLFGSMPLASALDVYVFNNSSFVDNAGSANSESDTVQASLAELGHTVNTFTNIAAEDWNAAFAAGVVLIPEHERGDLNAALDPTARSAIANQVASGGTLVIMNSDRGVSLLNAVFGWSLSAASSQSTSDEALLDVDNAAGTPFTNGPSTVSLHSATLAPTIESVAATGHSIYETSTHSVVFHVNVGSGSISYLGWDWFNAAPLGATPLNSWAHILNAAVVANASYSTSAMIGVEAPNGVEVENTLGTLVFSQTAPGDSSSHSVTIRNDGGQTLDDILVLIGGQDASSFQLEIEPPSFVGMGESSEFIVSFTPTTLGNKTAMLSISSNDENQNPFTLTLNGFGNNPPAFNGATFAAFFETSLSIPLNTLLSYASDPDGDAIHVLASGPVSEAGGTVTLDANAIHYTPPDGFSGMDSIPVTISDSLNATVEGFITVTVSVEGVFDHLPAFTHTRPILLEDINTQLNRLAAEPHGLTQVGVLLFFTARDENGRELWKSDGTDEGTVRVLDLKPGRESGFTEIPADHPFADVDGTLFFAVGDDAHGNELWKSDGTAEGTIMVKDIRPGSEGSNPRSLSVVDGILFFTADDGAHGRELWKSDGTESGTLMV